VNKNVHPSFWSLARSRPDAIALIDERRRPWTASELLHTANRIANGLRDLGASTSDVVATLMPSCADLLATSLATGQVGMYLLTINPRLSLPEMEHVLSDSGAKVLLIHKSLVNEAMMIRIAQWRKSLICLATGEIPGCRAYDELIRCASDAEPTGRIGGALLTYTSGTTGRPKGVLREVGKKAPEEVLGSMIEWYVRTFDVPTLDHNVYLSACPIFFSGPMLFASYPLHLGHTVVLLPGWEPRIALSFIQSYRVTNTFMVPYHFSTLLHLPEPVRARYSVSSLRRVIHGSAPCPIEVKRRMLGWLGDIVYESYGATEVGGTVCSAEEWKRHPGTVGRAHPPHELRILDSRGQELPAGQIGRVYFRATSFNRFAYRGDAKKTAAAYVGDFATVGDLGYLTEEGFLFLCDREADLIICRGENIYPAEIEAATVLHPAVIDCAAFGAPHAEWGEEVRLAVQLDSTEAGLPQVRDEIFALLASRIARAKLPRDIEFLAQIPRDAAGKLRRRELRDRFAAHPPMPSCTEPQGHGQSGM
jgi:long-chain acyl-CoA synthetase